MKRNELKKRINDGFSELAPYMFDEIIEKVKVQGPEFSEIKSEEIRKPMAKRKLIIYAMSACSAFVILCLCLFGVFFNKPDSLYMVLDINPSIQIEMNQSYRVKEIKGLNNDGKNVIKKLKWKKQESIEELISTLIEDVANQSYLREDEGILVTLYTSDNGLYNDLESKLEECIDRKLKNLGIYKVATAFYQERNHSDKKGRKVLEAELAENYGLDVNQVQQMSVKEIISYCKDNTLLDLNFCEPTENQQENEENTYEKEKNTIKKSSDKDLKNEKSKDKATEESTLKDDKSESSTVKTSESKETGQNISESTGSVEQKDTSSEMQSDYSSAPTKEEQTKQEQTNKQPETKNPKPTETQQKESVNDSDEIKENLKNNCFGDYYYKLLSDDSVEIIGYTGRKVKVEVPSLIDGKEVTKIGAGVFSNNLYIKTVVLPDSVKYIGESAFSMCQNLKHIYLSHNITSIENHTFYGCSNLRKIIIPTGVKSIGKYALYDCSSLRRITLPRTLTTVEEFAFDKCNGLKKVYYAGNIGNWKKINIGRNNECLEKAKIINIRHRFIKLKLAVESRKIEVGNKISVIATVRPLNSYNCKLEWISSDSSVATVDDKGVVTAISEGEVIITATAENSSGKGDSIYLKVVDSDNILIK